MNDHNDTMANSSFNQALDYYIDSLTGRSPRTKEAYEKDLVQLKLYLVLYRRHLVTHLDADTLAELESELIKAGGKLTDTRYLQRDYRTQVRSKTLLDRFDLGLDLLRKEDIVGYFGYLESTKSLARSTLLRRLAALRSFFGVISKDGFSVHPEVLERLTDMDIRRDRRLPVSLEENEALNFLRVIQDPRDRAMVLIMLFMGLRISEVVQLNVDDITDDTEGISLMGKGGKERFVPVHSQVKSAVSLYKSGRRPTVDPDPSGEPMFVSNRNRRIDPSTVRHLIKKYARQAEGIESRKKDKISPHKLRHTFATLLLQGEVDIRHIQELLGHEHLATTEIYTHVNRRDLHSAIDRHPLAPQHPNKPNKGQ